MGNGRARREVIVCCEMRKSRRRDSRGLGDEMWMFDNNQCIETTGGLEGEE